jgi:hypothetical protein
MRVLLDTGIFANSEFAEAAIKNTSVRWGDRQLTVPIHGVARRAPDGDPDYQREKEALFTVGRLIREGRLEAYDYAEIRFERVRGRAGARVCNALQGCHIKRCAPALDRSKFRRTVDFERLISKGGKKDRGKGLCAGDASQIAFLKWVCALTKQEVDLLVGSASRIGLSAFEVASLRELYWFQFLCRRWRTAENYPDLFHLWTAERNGIEALVTLEKRLPNFVSSVRRERPRKIEMNVVVLRPLELLREFGIEKPDPVPMLNGRFYYLHEVT